MTVREAASSPVDPAARARGVRRHGYVLLTLVAIGIVGARIATAPTHFSGNDLSRWSTIRALVDTGTYAIGQREALPDGSYRDTGLVARSDWDTIDKVMDPATGRFYSSKPALLPTVLAGEYWLLNRTLSLEFEHHRLAIVRALLATVNLLPFALYLIVIARLVERIGTTDWGRLFVFTAAGVGTFISGYLGSLNNHTVAAMSVLFAVYQCLRIHLDGDHRWWRFALAGLFAGWAFANELPAALLAVGVTLWLARLAPRLAFSVAVPALLLPAAALALAQYVAIGTPVPTYAQAEWYEFAGSYWLEPGNIDLAAEPKLRYAINLLIGHTGVLSLTPVLILGWIGAVRTVTRGSGATPGGGAARTLAALTAALTLITFVFYVFRTETYGGRTVGPRWLFWLVPLWLLTMLPEADRWASSRARRWIAGALLLMSVATAAYAMANPWQASPLLIVFRRFGWVSY